MNQDHLSSPFKGTSEKMLSYVHDLQDRICKGLESIESQTTFKTDSWHRNGGGGGITRVLENGNTFEKGGVNISAVHGTLENITPDSLFHTLLKQVDNKTFKLDNAQFFATGLSLVIHPKNPFVPTIHMNIRYFELQNDTEHLWWFGGGTDLTPYYLFDDDVVHFHQTLKQACDRHDRAYYETFKKQCDDYFYLPHRKETRGVGGIFFDYLHQQSADHYLGLVSSCGDCFLDSYIPIVKKRHQLPYTQHQRDWQRYRRGRYVEFNLLYDRGTLFGLKTNGRIESIFMSLPPDVSWIYCFEPEDGSEEAILQDLLRQTPKSWIV